MALVTCEDCGHEVSDQAEACPQCGRPPRTSKTGSYLLTDSDLAAIARGEDVCANCKKAGVWRGLYQKRCPYCGSDIHLVPKRKPDQTGPKRRPDQTAAGVLLQFIGFGWAILGIWNLVGMFERLSRPGTNLDAASTTALFGLIANFILFVLPGLVVGALGTILNRRRS